MVARTPAAQPINDVFNREPEQVSLRFDQPLLLNIAANYTPPVLANQQIAVLGGRATGP